MLKRIKNPWFWVGLVGIFLTAIGVDPSTMTTWAAVGDTFMNVVKNPFMLVTAAMAIIGVFVDPSTAGIKDEAKINETTIEEAAEALKSNPELLSKENTSGEAE